MPNWVILPCHNNSDLLQIALDSILAQTIPVNIFAINNGSEDNTARVLEGLGHEHIVVHAYPQLGVSRAWNLGLKYLFDHGEERVLVVNQDVVLLPQTYEELDRHGHVFNTAVSVSDLHGLSSFVPSLHYIPRPHPDFSCFRITKQAYRAIGPFDEGFYPAWFEDNDYHIRAARAGIELQCIDIPFYHLGGGTMKRASNKDREEYYNPGFDRSKKRFFEKWGVLPGTTEYEELCTVK